MEISYETSHTVQWIYTIKKMWGKKGMEAYVTF
jgi:hypothetical protein